MNNKSKFESYANGSLPKDIFFVQLFGTTAIGNGMFFNLTSPKETIFRRAEILFESLSFKSSKKPSVALLNSKRCGWVQHFVYCRLAPDAVVPWMQPKYQTELGKWRTAGSPRGPPGPTGFLPLVAVARKKKQTKKIAWGSLQKYTCIKRCNLKRHR